MRDFHQELKERLDKLEHPKLRYVSSPKPKETLWEIRKRSLNPIGIDQYIIGGLKMPWAIPFWHKHFPMKSLENGQIIYYDLIKENSSTTAFSNPQTVIKANIDDFPERFHFRIEDVKSNES